MKIKKNVISIFRDEFQVSKKNEEYVAEVNDLLSVLYLSDKSKNGDITSRLLINKDLSATAYVICKSNGIFAGAQELLIFIDKLNISPPLSVCLQKNDGDRIKPGDILLTIKGNARQLLSLERIILNLLQHMSGIATQTREYIKDLPKSVLISATRKTNWGALDKRACFLGGGGTHRMNLGDAYLIKNNHVNLFDGDYRSLLVNIRQLNKGRFIDFEVGTFKEANVVFEWIKANNQKLKRIPVVVMFDNFKSEKLNTLIVKLGRTFNYNDIILEASGGINKNNIRNYAKTGVDILSIGELTNSVKVLDISMKIVPN